MPVVGLDHGLTVALPHAGEHIGVLTVEPGGETVHFAQRPTFLTLKALRSGMAAVRGHDHVAVTVLEKDYTNALVIVLVGHAISPLPAKADSPPSCAPG